MRNQSFGQFVKKDPLLSLGSALSPSALLIFSFLEQSAAENMQPHLISISQSFTAILFAALALVISMALAMVFSVKISTPNKFSRGVAGVAIGMIVSVSIAAAFYLIFM